MHFSRRTCKFMLLVIYKFYPMLTWVHHMLSSLLITNTSSLCSVILSFLYLNAERLVHYQLLGYRWFFFAVSTLQLFALQICVHNCAFRNDVTGFVHWQTCNLFSSWLILFCWLLLLRPSWIPEHTKKHCHVCSAFIILFRIDLLITRKSSVTANYTAELPMFG